MAVFFVYDGKQEMVSKGWAACAATGASEADPKSRLIK